MITTMRLVKAFVTSFSYLFCVYMVRTFKIHFLSNFEVYKMVQSTVVSMLYVITPEFTHLIAGSLDLWTSISLLSPLPSLW